MIYEIKELQSLLEDNLCDELENIKYSSDIVDPKKFLSHKRFDLAFKLFYLDELSDREDLAKKIYKEHIRAFSLGKYTEPGDKNKRNINDFYSAFNRTFNNIKENGFDNNKTLIVSSPSGDIANGAHRVASSIFLKKKVEFIKLKTFDQDYDYKFFKDRRVNESHMDEAAKKFIKFSDNSYVAFIWPSANGHDSSIEKKIPNIVYRKNIKLNINGAHNLLSQIYFKEPWLGDIYNNYAGAKVKVLECFKNTNSLRVIVFQADSIKDVLRIKESIRRIFNIGKHSIHITDTKEEAIRTSNLVLNNSAIKFLNFSKPNKFINFNENLEKIKKHLNERNISPKNYIFWYKSLFSIFGICNNIEIDYIELSPGKTKLPFSKEVSLDSNQLVKLNSSGLNIFMFNDLNFISADFVFNNREDLFLEADAKCIEELYRINKDKNSLKDKFFSNINRNFYYSRALLRKFIVVTLKKLGLIKTVKKFLMFMKNK